MSIKILTQIFLICSILLSSDNIYQLNSSTRNTSLGGTHVSSNNISSILDSPLRFDSVNSNNNLYSHLIIFEGNNSLFNANTFLNSLPLLFQNEIKKAIFINNRRWDVKLRNGINIKLSENNILDSFNNYDKFYKNVSNQELTEIEMIDLRIPKQIILKFKAIK